MDLQAAVITGLQAKTKARNDALAMSRCVAGGGEEGRGSSVHEIGRDTRTCSMAIAVAGQDV
jgi:hypothetical protein